MFYIYTLKNLAKFTGVSFLIKVQAGQLCSFEFCEIFKNTFFTGHLQTTASENKSTPAAAKNY